MAEFLLLVLIACNNMQSVPLRVSPETTWITEPLTPDGKHVDYVAAFKQRLYPPGIVTDDNGFRLVFQRIKDVGNSRKLPPGVVRKYREKLGLDLNHKPDLTYLDFDGFILHVFNNEPELLGDVIPLIVETLPEWRTDKKVEWYDIHRFLWYSHEPHTFAVIRRYVEEYGPALDIIAEAVAKPVYFIPTTSGYEVHGLYRMYEESSLSFMQEGRNFARGFPPRIRYRVATGDIDGAIDDILACYRLGRHYQRQGTQVASLVGVAVEGIAAMMAIDSNPAVPASEEQLRRLAEGIRNLPPRISEEQIFEIERFFALDMIQSASAGKTPASTLLGTKQWRAFLEISPTPSQRIVEFIFDSLGYDWNIVARRFNKYFDEAISTTEASPPLDWHPWSLLTVNSRSHGITDILYRNTVPSFKPSREAFRRNTCTGNMKQIALAMLIYERRHGALPPAFSVDENGRPLHSWRVLLLPYLGDDSPAELYAQIRLDEPWDSEHNRQFHARNLDIYRCPSADKNDGETSYSVIVGDELLFDKEGRERLLTGLKRHVVLLTERKEGVCWMRPDAEISQQAAESDLINGSDTSIGSKHTGGVNIALRDGSAGFMSETVSQDGFRELLRGSDKLPW